MEGSRMELERPIADAISRIRFAPLTDRLLISSWDSVLRLYDDGESVLRLEAPSEGAVLDCCFQDESAAFAACSDCCVRRLDFSSKAWETLTMHGDAATCVEYSVEYGLLISSGLDKKIFFHDQRKHTKCSPGDTIMTYSDIEYLSLCGIHLLVATGRSVQIYDMRNLTGPVQLKESSLEYQISCIGCFSTYEGYATGSIDGRIALEFFDPLKAKESSCIFRCHPKSKDRRDHLVRVNDIKFHPSLDNFVTGDSEGHAIMWDAKSRKRLLEFPRYNNSVSSLSFNGDGQRLAVAISYTYQEANECEESPHIFIYNTDDLRKLSKEKHFCLR